MSTKPSPNEKVVTAFLAGQEKAYAGCNMSSYRSPGLARTMLRSYATTVAMLVTGTAHPTEPYQTLYITNHRYSPTTDGHLRLLKIMARAAGINTVVYVSHAEEGNSEANQHANCNAASDALEKMMKARMPSTRGWAAQTLLRACDAMAALDNYPTYTWTPTETTRLRMAALTRVARGAGTIEDLNSMGLTPEKFLKVQALVALEGGV